MSTFEELQARVAKDTALQERLQAAEDEDTFVEMVEEFANELGLDLDTETIRTGIEQSTARATTELSDTDLAEVAGGTFHKTVNCQTYAYDTYLCFGGRYTGSCNSYDVRCLGY